MLLDFRTMITYFIFETFTKGIFGQFFVVIVFFVVVFFRFGLRYLIVVTASRIFRRTRLQFAWGGRIDALFGLLVQLLWRARWGSGGDLADRV